MGGVPARGYADWTESSVQLVSDTAHGVASISERGRNRVTPQNTGV